MSKRRRGNDGDYFRALLHASSEGIAVIDAEGVVRDETPAFRRMLGIKGPGLTGRSISHVIHPEDVAKAMSCCVTATRSSDPVGPVRWRLRQPDDSWRIFEVTLHNRLEDPTVGALVLAMRDIADMGALEHRLRTDAFRDALTGLGNRVVLFDRVRIALARQRPGSAVAVLFLDLDDFKSINDSWGHAAGDALLVSVAERLRDCLRPEDTAARLGGDEFAVLLENLESAEQAGEVGQRILESLREPCTVGDSVVLVQSSIGIAVSAPGQQQAEEILRDADVSMYAAKARGKGRCEYFDADMRVGAVEKLELRARLQSAIDNGDFVLHYQPVVDLTTGHVTGAEALLRWRDRQRGLVPPGRFVGLAEEAGMMDTIGRWVLRDACRTAQRFQFEGGRAFRVNVNLSARQLDQPGLAREIAEILADCHLPPECLVVEITEQMFMQDSAHVLVNLHELKEAGVRLAIDDFGTGYSSLSYLQRFPVDYLKIDKSFVDELDERAQQPALARAIIQIAHSLDLMVVGEGVERPDQLRQLREMGCDYGQGYLFAKPMEATALAKFLRLARGEVALDEVGRPALRLAETSA